MFDTKPQYLERKKEEENNKNQHQKIEFIFKSKSNTLGQY